LRLSNDERLYTSELYGININANLIVLSACETARGEIRGGESTIGLTLGFLYAGAKSVIGSLWNVNQNSTNHFITALYTQFKNHKSENTSVNLQQAKLELIAQNPAYAHPKYWAAFVLVGNPDVEIALSTPFWQQPYFIFILFFVFLFFIKYYKSIFYKIYKKNL
jgi:CHAT domain-containing protein